MANYTVSDRKLTFYVLTLFPDMIAQAMSYSIIGRASLRGIVSIVPVNIRDFAGNIHGKVDDYPYGGGAGMVMQAEPVYASCMYAKELCANTEAPVIFMSPAGKTFRQSDAVALSSCRDIIILCGHYEGIDERVLEELQVTEISVGDYVLTGGELPAMVIMDAISRMVPGVLTNNESGLSESFSGDMLEYPQYTRPDTWRGRKVPPVLLSGHHANIDKWRHEQSVERTRLRRPDLATPQ